MPEPLRLLLVDGSAAEAEQVLPTLRGAGFVPSYTCVATPEALKAQLDTADWDMVIADDSLQGLAVEDVLAIVQARHSEIPVIVVSAHAIPPERVVSAIRGGASEYLTKGDWPRLAEAIRDPQRPACSGSLSLHEQTQRPEVIVMGTRLAAIEASSSESCGGLKPAGHIEDWNAGATQLDDYAAEEMIGQSLPLVVPADRAHEQAHTVQEWARGTALPRFETARRPASGAALDVSMTVSPVRDAGGYIVDCAGIAAEIGERTRAEEAAHRSESMYRLLAENSTDTVARLAPDGTMLYCSPACETLLGYEPAELVGRAVRDLTHPDDLQTLLTTQATLLEHAGVHTTSQRLLRKDGTLIWVETTIRSVHDPGTGVLVEFQCATRDISERKRAEDALRESEALFRTLIETSPIGFTLTDAEGRIEVVNSAYCALLGYAPDELLGRCSTVPVPDHARDGELQTHRDVPNHSERTTDIVVLSCKDGRPATVLAQTAPAVGRDGRTKRVTYFIDLTEHERLSAALQTSETRLQAAIAHALLVLFALDRDGVFTFQAGGSLTTFGVETGAALGESVFTRLAEYPDVLAEGLRALSGQAFSTVVDVHDRVFEVWWTPELNDAGGAMGGTGIAVDVTDTIRAQREAEHARAAALALAQLRSDFVASVSHELRTPLTAIVGYGEILQAHWHRLDEAQRLDRVGRIVLAANRQKRLVEDLLLVSRLENNLAPVQPVPVSIGTLVQRVAAETKGAYPGQHIELSGPTTLRMLADPDRTMQILANILDNAAKYSPEGSPIAVTWSRDHDAVVLRVRDQGSGIADDGRAQLFTRFGRVPGSRMRAGHVGTGLGLYIGRQLAGAMGGELDLESSGPTGSTFRLRLPRYQAGSRPGARRRSPDTAD